jgi:hypothetical protein
MKSSSKIANPELAATISNTIVKPSKRPRIKKDEAAPENEVASLPGGESLQKVEKKVFTHIQHQYDKDAKIQRQSCLKAAASVYNPPFGEDVDVIANKVIQIAERLYQWVNSN